MLISHSEGVEYIPYFSRSNSSDFPIPVIIA